MSPAGGTEFLGMAPGACRESIVALVELVERQRTLAANLVRTEPVSRRSIDTEIEAIDHELIERHPLLFDPILRSAGTGPPGASVPSKVLIEEHRRFLESIDQLRWFYGVVRAEDHGGHRQALGQYWKLVLESVARHLEDEAEYVDFPGAVAVRR